MNEIKFAGWRFPAGQLLPGAGNVATATVDLSSHPALVAELADWEPVSHTVQIVDDGTLWLTVMLRRKTSAPDSPADLG